MSILKLLFFTIPFTIWINQENPINPKFPELFRLVPSYTSNLEDWHLKLYSHNPNIFEIKKFYTEYYSKNDFQKNIHTQNYKQFFKRLANGGYEIDEEGYIVSKIEKSLSNLRFESSSIPSTILESENQWTPLGPNLIQNTYEWGERNHANIYNIHKSSTTDNMMAST